MKNLHKLTVTAVAAMAMSSASAAGLSGVLDGMFTNVTAPDVVSNQFRGTISGGGVYVRAPISNLQVMSLDPPRLSIGCGGIDLYLGSFSFITAEKLTQFIRNTAQNAAPLAFKMALDASFPQLGGVLDKFQHMAQMMNDSQRNSCQLAHGIMDGAKNAEDVFNNLSKTVSDGLSTVKGWASDFTEAFTSDQDAPSKNIEKARKTKNADGTSVAPQLGNLTWNALNTRKYAGFVFSITDDTIMSQQVIMSLIGTTVRREGDTPEAEPKNSPFPPQRLRLKDLFRPATGTAGIKEIPIWSCQGDNNECLSPTASTFATTGIEGFVRAKMFGAENASTPLPGSIVYKMTNCTAGACGMSSGQLQFLNSIGKIPAVGLMTRAQGVPGIINMISVDLVDAMVDEISVAYGRSVVDIAVTSYAKTDSPKPEGFDDTINNMLADLSDAEKASKVNLTRLNTMATYIDTAIRANGAVLRYRPN